MISAPAAPISKFGRTPIVVSSIAHRMNAHLIADTVQHVAQAIQSLTVLGERFAGQSDRDPMRSELPAREELAAYVVAGLVTRLNMHLHDDRVWVALRF